LIAGAPRAWRRAFTGCSCSSICISVSNLRIGPASAPRGRISACGLAAANSGVTVCNFSGDALRSNHSSLDACNSNPVDCRCSAKTGSKDERSAALMRAAPRRTTVVTRSRPATKCIGCTRSQKPAARSFVEPVRITAALGYFSATLRRFKASRTAECSESDRESSALGATDPRPASRARFGQ
jgi:hypothetical protein